MNRPVRVAVIGAGPRGSVFCDFIARNPDKAQLLAIADLYPDRARILIDRFGFKAAVSQDHASILDLKDIEAVMIATPDYAHTEPVISALKAKKSVYVEKPLATTLKDCDKIIQAAAKRDVLCYVGFNLRHGPVHEKVHSLITRGKVGKVLTIEANEWYCGGKTYFRRWHRFREYSGGLWVTKACHDFDIVTWLAGAKPINVFATSRLSLYKPKKNAGHCCRDCKIKNSCPDFYNIFKKERHWFSEAWRKLQLQLEKQGLIESPDICLYNSEKDTFDNGMAIIQYDNDVLATYTLNVVASRTTRQIRVNGTDGLIEADMADAVVKFVHRHKHKTEIFDLQKECVGNHGGADDKIFTDFFNKCSQGGKPRSGLDEGRLALQLAIAARDSDDQKKAQQIT